MDITGQFQQVEIFLTDDRLLAVLKKMAAPLVPEVEVDGVAGHQAPQAPGQGLFSGPDKQMKMVGHQGPRHFLLSVRLDILYIGPGLVSSVLG